MPRGGSEPSLSPAGLYETADELVGFLVKYLGRGRAALANSASELVVGAVRHRAHGRRQIRLRIV